MELRPFKTDALWENLRQTIEQSPLPDEAAGSLLELSICAERALDTGRMGTETLSGAISDIVRVASDGLPLVSDAQQTFTTSEVACQRGLVAILTAVQVLSECLCLSTISLARVERNRRCQVGGPNAGRCFDEQRHICIERKINGRFACLSLGPLSIKGLETSVHG